MRMKFILKYPLSATGINKYNIKLEKNLKNPERNKNKRGNIFLL